MGYRYVCLPDTVDPRGPKETSRARHVLTTRGCVLDIVRVLHNWISFDNHSGTVLDSHHTLEFPEESL